MSTGNDSTRTLQLWRKDIRESGIHLCLLTTVGMWSGMTLLQSIRDKPKSVVQIMNKANFVVLNDTLACFHKIFNHLMSTDISCLFLDR